MLLQKLFATFTTFLGMFWKTVSFVKCECMLSNMEVLFRKASIKICHWAAYILKIGNFEETSHCGCLHQCCVWHPCCCWRPDSCCTICCCKRSGCCRCPFYCWHPCCDKKLTDKLKFVSPFLDFLAVSCSKCSLRVHRCILTCAYKHVSLRWTKRGEDINIFVKIFS